MAQITGTLELYAELFAIQRHHTAAYSSQHAYCVVHVHRTFLIAHIVWLLLF
jgi:hypothetical protein